MKKTEQGFVLQKIAYSETSFVAKIFTQNHGLKAFMVKGGNKKFASIFQALSHIEFTYYQKNEDQLANLFEPQLVSNFQEIYFNPLKQSIAFFETEFLVQCLHENQADLELYEFIKNELFFLNQEEFHPNYLIFWIAELSGILGFRIQVEDEDGQFFDLINGEITRLNSLHSESASGEIVKHFASFLCLSREEQLIFEFSKDERKQILEILLTYFKLHIDSFKKIKSLEVYQTLWYD